MVSAAILLPLIGAVVVLFGTGVDYYGGEQRAAKMNDEARNAVEIMSLEVGQAGTRRDVITAATAAFGAGAQTVQVASNKGFSVGDSVVVDSGAAQETVTLTAIGTGTISAVFNNAHSMVGGNGANITCYALPYVTGVVPPAGLLPVSSVTTNVLRFYGDFYDDGDLYYVEYVYNSATSQITKSITSLSQANENAPEVLIRNVTAASFTLYSDAQGAVTLVKADLTVQSTWQKKPQSSRISVRMAAPGVASASTIQRDNATVDTPYILPATPAKVVTWSTN